MNDFSLGDFNFLVFIIQGFLTVWVFRYFIKSKKVGDFELLGLSFFWGLVILVIWSFFNKILYREARLGELLQNPYATSIVLSFFGALFGWVGSFIVSWSWFRKFVDKISLDSKK